MLYALLIAHLLGDYVFQIDAIAKWKSRSVLGVLVHGSIVTLCTLACVALFDAAWWPYALLIGVFHTAIDLVRSHLVPCGLTTGWDLALYLTDQTLHLLTIVGVLWGSGKVSPGMLAEIGMQIRDSRWMAIITGYCLLTWPTWVLVRFLVRGFWGPDAAPPLSRQNDRYGPMLERTLIATAVLMGQATLVPLVLIPRPMARWLSESEGAPPATPREHWAEVLLSTLLAVDVGLVLRSLGRGGSL